MDLSKRRVNFKSILIPIAILVLAAASFMLLKMTKPEAEAKPVTSKRWPVSATLAQVKSYTPEIELLGNIESPFQTQITAAVTGYVARIHALEGETLPANQILISIDDKDSRLLLQQRQADLNNQTALVASEQLQQENNQQLLEQDLALLALNQSSVKRLKSLARQGSASQSSLDEAQQALIRQKMAVANRQLSLANHPFRIDQLKAQQTKAAVLYQQAKLDLERTQALTPYNARIADLMVAPGDRVTPGKVLASLYPYDQLEVRAQLPAALISQLPEKNAGHSLQATAHYQGKTLPLQLRSLSAQVRTGQAGVDALFRFKADTSQNPIPALPLGQSVAITLYLPPVEQAIALPGTAFYGQSLIYSVQDGVLVSHKVQRLGSVSAGFSAPHILIPAAQVPKDSPILTTQLPNAISGLPVTVIAEPAASQENL